MQSYLLQTILLLAAGFSLIHGDVRTLQDPKKLPTMNDLVDKALIKIAKLIISDGYEPMELPDYEASFLHIGLLGKLKLTNCKLHNMSTLYRSEDVVSEQVEDGLDVDAAVAFTKLKLNCTYVASILGILKKKGEVVVNLPQLNAEVDLNFAQLKFHLIDLQLVNNGPIDVHLEGGLLDDLASILTQTISNLFKSVILNQVEKKMEDKLREILEGSKKTNIHESPQNIIYV